MDILKPDFGIKEDTFNMTEDDAPIKQSVYIAKDYNPDEFAKAYSVAEKFQTSPMFVADNMQDFEKKAEENDLVDKLKKAQYVAPQTVDIMSRPDNLSLAKDDLDSLIDFERKKRNYSFASDAYNNVAAGVSGVAKGLLQIPTTLPSMIATLGEDNQNTLLGSPLVQAGVEVFRQFGQNNSAANYLNEKQKEFAAKSPSINSDAFDLIKNGRFGEGGRVLGVQILGQIPQLTALIGTSIVAGPAAGLTYAGVSTATESFNQDIAEGVDKQTALAASAGKGVIEAAFEGIGSLGFVNKTISRVAKTSGKIAANEVAKSMIETVAKGALINGTEEFATSLGQDYVSYITGENPNALVGADGRAFNSFMIGFGSGGALEAPAAIMAGVATREKQVQVKNDQDFYDQAGAIAKDSKVMQRMPEKYRQIIDEQTKDGTLENVYISREGFKEYAQRVGKPEAELAAEMKIQDELNRADETGADIEVKTSKMSVDVVKTEHYAALRGDVKFKADGFTENELKRQAEQVRENLKEQIDNANKALTPDESERLDKEAKQVGQMVADKLRNDAEISGHETKHNAVVYDGFFRSMGLLFGKSPLEFYNQYGLNIQKINRALMDKESQIQIDEKADLMSLLAQNEQMPSDLQFASRDENNNIVVDDFNLNLLRKRINESQAGERLTKKDENGNVIGNIAQPSTFPEFAKGYTKKEILTAIDNYKSGKKLTEKQAVTLEAVYNGMIDSIARREYFQQSSNKNNLGFYSKLITTVEQKMSASQDVNSLKSMLKEIKADEAKWLGLDAFLKGKEKVSKAELLDYLKANELNIEEVKLGYIGTNIDFNQWEKRELNQGFKNPNTNKFERFNVEYYSLNQEVNNDVLSASIKKNPFTDKYELSANATNFIESGEFASFDEAKKYLKNEYLFNAPKTSETKYSSYKTQGGENYREVLFTLPAKKIKTQTAGQISERMFGKNFYDLNEQEIIAVNEEYQKGVKAGIDSNKNKYQSSHWDQKNVLAHTRLQDFTDADGNKVLVIEEIQSDWHQEGRKKGYKGTFTASDNEKLNDIILEINVAREKWEYEISKKIIPLENEISEIEKQGPPSQLPRIKQVDSGYYAYFLNGEQVSESVEKRADLDLSSINKNALKKEEIDKIGAWIRRTDLLKEIDKIKGNYESYSDVAKHLAKNGYISEDLLKEYLRLNEIQNADAKGQLIPDAPFAKNWHEFVFKRILTMAVEQGYDKVAWTSGEQQAERFDLSKQVDKVSAKKNEDGTYDVEATKDNRILSEQSNVAESSLESLFGKDLAEKIIKQSGKSQGKNGYFDYEADDLKVGGEGMKGFYDKILVDYAKKLGKKYDAQVSDLQIDTVKNDKFDYTGPIFTTDELKLKLQDKKLLATPYSQLKQVLRVMDTNGYSFKDAIEEQGSPMLAEFLGGELKLANQSVKLHSLEITDKLKQQIQGQGFELFQDKRASIVQIGNKKFNINLFEEKNESSFMHESAHFFLEVLGDAATSEGATEEGKAFYAEVLKLLNVESREQIGEKEQEMFARSFEAYLMEGKAPNEKLRKAFAAFKTWLVNIYKNIAGIENEAGFKVNVSPEMKSFFDRMLASEQEIAAYRKDAPQPIASQNAILEVLNEQEALEYLNAVELSRLDAEDKLRAKLMNDLIRKADSKYKAKFNELLEQGYKTANEFQEFKTMKAIKENPELRISSEIADKIDKKYRQYLPKDLFVKDGGMDVQAVAEMFGYPNSGSLLEALMPYRKGIDAWAETYAATEIKKSYPELLESPELSNEAIKAAHNENYGLVKKFELEFLAKNYPRVVKNATEKLIRRMPKTQAVIQQARSLIATTNVREIKPHVYLNAERKFAAIAAKEFKKGNFEAAFEAKYKEYLNFELYREAVKAKEDVEKRVQKFKDNFKRKDEDLAKSRDTDLINAGREILKQFGILSGPRSEVDHLEKIKAYEPDVYQHLKGLVDVVAANAGNYTNISYNKFVEMADVVDSIWDLSKSRRQIEIDGKKMDTKEVAADLAARIRTLTPQELEQIKKVSDDSGKFKTSLLSLKASLTRVEAWASGMGGNFHKYIYQPIADATTQYRLDKEKYLNKYKVIVEQFLKPQDQVQMFETPIISTELNAEFKGKMQLIGALLHTGNESNISKLLEGRGWADKNADGTLSTNRWDMFINRMISEGVLTKDDFDFVQSVWDLFEEMKPSVQKAHKQILGYYMNEITAKPFSNKFGEYRGGYAPAKTDPNSVQGADLALKQMAENLGSDASFVFPTTGRGATKTRNEAYKAPLSVDLNMVASHIEWAVKFANVEPAVKQVLSVIKTPEFSNALFDFDKTLMQSMIMPWLDRTAKQTRIEQSKGAFGKLLDKGSGFLRRNSSTAIMTLNVVNAMEQFGGLSVAMTMVKPAKIKLAFIDYINNPSKMVDFVIEKSSFMKSTQGSNIYELNDQINDFLLNPSKFDEMKAYFRKHTYILQTFTQNIVNTVSWVGAYNQAIEDGKTETEAIKFADSVIRQTQGTNLPEDVSEYETGTQTSLLFKQFTGYFNMLANLSDARIKEIAREIGLRKGAGRLFYLYMTLMAVPAAISTALRMGAAGAAADEDDDESFADDFLANFFGTQARTVFATVPYAGQVLNAAYGKIATKQQYDDRLSLSPAISILESASQGPGGVIKDLVEKGEVSKRSLKDSLMFIGLMTSTPTNVLGKPLGYLMDVQSGRAEPTGPIDFTRGLVTGKPGSQ